MSTATPPGIDKRADWQRKVSDPLERLRGYIRLYVSVEGAAILVVYLALWFWIGLAIDYGFFKLFTVDWVQVLPVGPPRRRAGHPGRRACWPCWSSR